MVLSLTGHRPQDLPSKWNRKHPWKIKKIESLISYLDMISPAYIISGGALGWDSWGIYSAIKAGIKYKVYVPFKGQESIWSEQQKKIYFRYLDKALEIKYICPDGYSAWKMQKRNEAMVQDADKVLALWNPEKKHGGTWNCMAYATSMQKEIINFWGDKPTLINLNNGIGS